VYEEQQVHQRRDPLKRAPVSSYADVQITEAAQALHHSF
jgi:hypothetical protein